MNILYEHTICVVQNILKFHQRCNYNRVDYRDSIIKFEINLKTYVQVTRA